MVTAMTDAEQAALIQKQATQAQALDYLRRILLAPVYDVAVETALTPMTKLSSRLGNQIFLKREDQQPVHSFKLRGAYNKLANLSEQQCLHGVIAASAGNHAQGLALAAHKLGIKATIVMPITTPDIKVDNVRRYGAEVRLIGKSFNEAQQASMEYAQAENKTVIHPFDDSDVIAGQGTVAKELLQQRPHTDVVFIPVGGGGLLAGMAVYLKQLQPHIKVIGVEAEDSACLKAALAAGKPVDLAQVGLFADGVAVKRIGEHTFDLIKHYCDEVITVTTDEICTSIKDIFEQTRVISEPAGALSLAGLQKYCQSSPGDESLVAILSGANMNFHTLRYISERCELGEQKEAVFAVKIPEEKGSFRNFCKALAGRVITEFNYRYADNADASNETQNANIFVGVRLGGEANDREKLTESLQQSYQLTDFTENELAKLHVRYMIGGKNELSAQERIFRFQFPEYPGALEKFLDTLGEHYNITLFHYRNHGAAFGQVLAGFEVKKSQEVDFFTHLKALDYECQEETNNEAYKAFLT
ncbi:threonine ammonia-lyase, biosynthetic [Colwellia sp. 6M3]|jgi:threonine dehydratase|nr:threonine ammonia-lyase, biosynthetic [Colwellia sp. Arc7-D]MBA6415076.1 threonine ammonia-lyase, biosynthetic [Colwellia sp. 6M3]|tara:strand:+ start:2599 stop:4188 length:1590 start_codon:yes stop_codon:yes gene_type:complete